MKNIEKYPNTEDALKAFREWYRDHPGTDLTMSGWLEKEYVEPRESTLLEAAEKLIMGFVNNWSEEWSSMECLENLREAVKREKKKPVRNCDKYRSISTASVALKTACCKQSACSQCPYRGKTASIYNCLFNWLYAEAKNEEAR